MAVVESHLHAGGNYPRGLVIESLAVVLGSAPHLDHRAKAGIVALGPGLRATDMGPSSAAFISPHTSVRTAVWEALARMPSISSLPYMDSVTTTLWLARHDTDATNAAIGDSLWRKYNHAFPAQAEKYLGLLLTNVGHKEEEVRNIVAAGIAGAMCAALETIPAALAQLFSLYEEHMPPDYDKAYDNAANIQIRNGIAKLFAKIAGALGAETLPAVFNWMIETSLGGILRE